MRTLHALAAVCALVGAGCGGGGGTGEATQMVSVSFSPNSIVYGVANGQAANYEINEMSPTGSGAETVVASLPATELLFAIDPVLPHTYALAADPTGGGTYGIYLSTTITLSGAVALVAPTYTYVSSIAVTQDGTHIVFSATDGTGVSNLFSVPTAGGAVTELGLSDGSAASPLDSDTIAYSAPVNGFGNDQIFTRSLAAGPGGATTQITSDGSNHLLPCWNPDGLRLAFWEENSGTNTLVIETLSGSSTVSLPNPAGISPQGEAFSADGSTLVIVGELNSQGNIFTQPVSGASTPVSITSSGSLLGNYGVFWTDANGRATGSIQGMNSVLRRKLRQAKGPTLAAR